MLMSSWPRHGPSAPSGPATKTCRWPHPNCLSPPSATDLSAPASIWPKWLLGPRGCRSIPARSMLCCCSRPRLRIAWLTKSSVSSPSICRFSPAKCRPPAGDRHSFANLRPLRRLEQRPDGSQCLLSLGTVRATALRHIRTATTALTAQGGRSRLDERTGGKAPGKILGDADGDSTLAILALEHDGHNA